MKRKALTVKGVAVAPGLAIGRAWVCDRTSLAAVPAHPIEPARVDGELVRFRQALDRSRVELLELHRLVESKSSRKDADIFLTHIQVLNDPYLVAQVEADLKTTLMNLESVLANVIRKFQEIFLSIDDSMIRARSADVMDVGTRILRNLAPEEVVRPGQPGDAAAAPDESLILIADELVPSMTVRKSGRIAGMVTERGDVSSHAAILARSFNIPALVDVPGAIGKIRNGDTVIVDAQAGRVIVGPSETTLKRYRAELAKLATGREQMLAEAELPCETIDGHALTLSANIGLPEEAELVLKYGLPGVGLFRTEFFFMHRDTFPSEEEQTHLYRQVAETLAGRELTIRLLDLASDKKLEYFKLGESSASMLGFRGLRILLAHREILRIQVRAILQAAVYGNVRLLVPMVTTLDEARDLLAFVDSVKAELAAERRPFDDAVPVGFMIEVPSMLYLLGEMGELADFFSVGTNDLIQYVLAADRNVREVAYLYNPFDRSILRVLDAIREGVAATGRRLSICGELAGDPYFTNLLIALGFTELSMNVHSVPLVRRVVRATSMDRAAAILDRVFSGTTREAAGAAREETRRLLDESGDAPFCLI